MRLECEWRHARKRWAENLGIFEKQSVGDKMPNWEPVADRGLWALSDPWLSNPAKMRKKYCWVNIAVCPCLQLISHTQPTSTLSRIKCERYIFIKKCLFVRSLKFVIMFDYVPHIFVYVYIYVCGYTTRPCLTLSIIRYLSRVKWSNPRKRVAPSPTPQCC